MSQVGSATSSYPGSSAFIVIDRAEILAALFGEVLIPKAVPQELRHPKAPAAVSRWLQELPFWLHIAAVQQMDETIQLGKGGNEASSPAVERQVKVVLMDERQGRGGRQRLGD